MPRKTSFNAQAQAAKAQAGQWSYLVRSVAFLNDIKQLHHRFFRRKRVSIKSWENSRTRVADKYGLLRIPAEVIANYPFLDAKALEYYGVEWGISYSPVAAVEVIEDRFLLIRVDLYHPVDDVMPLIEEELRNIYHRRPKRRRRFDKVQFNCTVYDLAKAGKKFSEIATCLDKSVSTVKSAYLVATRHIFSFGQCPRKKDLPIVAFDSHRHCQSCIVCRKAQSVEEMCSEARVFANLESRALREKTGLDVTGFAEPDNSA